MMHFFGQYKGAWPFCMAPLPISLVDGGLGTKNSSHTDCHSLLNSKFHLNVISLHEFKISFSSFIEREAKEKAVQFSDVFPV
jgi:hypothetical protein